MILDELNEFADAVSVANIAATINVGDQIDLQVVRDIGNGQPVYLVITTAVEIITGGSAGTINFALVSDSVVPAAVDGSQTVHYRTRDFVTDDAAANDALLNAGGVIACVALPLEGPAYERYLSVQAVIGTTTTTAGAINAFLTLDPKGYKMYPDAVN